MIVVVDTGPLYAVADADDDDHERCVAVLEDARHQLVVPSLVVAEAAYLIGTRLGPRVESAFLRGLAALEVEVPWPEEWERIAELVEEYEDFPLGGIDASVVALAERLDAGTVATLDRRHFGAVRPRHRESLRLVP